jgi:hypothetical protein
MPGMGVLPHVRKLDDALGHFLVQITCKCGASRIAEPEALARLCGSSATLEAVGRRMRCSKCGKKGAEVVAVSIPRIRGRGVSSLKQPRSGARAGANSRRVPGRPEGGMSIQLDWG